MLIGIVLLTQYSHSQTFYWRQTNGPSGGTVQSFAGYGDNIFASSTYIYWSCDQGRSWHIINSSNTSLYSVATNSTTLFALGSYQTLASTSDLGHTWNSLYIQIPGYPQLTGLWLFENRLYLGTVNGLYISSDEGKTWSSSLLSNQVINTIGQSGQFLCIGTNTGIFSSKDGGTTFKFSA